MKSIITIGTLMMMVAALSFAENSANVNRLSLVKAPPSHTIPAPPPDPDRPSVPLG